MSEKKETKEIVEMKEKLSGLLKLIFITLPSIFSLF